MPAQNARTLQHEIHNGGLGIVRKSRKGVHNDFSVGGVAFLVGTKQIRDRAMEIPGYAVQSGKPGCDGAFLNTGQCLRRNAEANSKCDLGEAKFPASFVDILRQDLFYIHKIRLEARVGKHLHL